MYKFVVKHILFPAYFAKNKNKMLEHLSMMEKSQWLSPEEIRNTQLKRLKKLLDHCYENVAFYKTAFDKVGFHPKDLRSLEDIREIPYLSKKDLQTNTESLIAGNHVKANLIPDASGGSTGIPTNFYKDIERWQLRDADQIRHDRWCGWDVGEKKALLWGAPRDFEENPSLKYKIVEKYLHRLYAFNAFDISDEKIIKYLKSLIEIKPVMIIAYANMAYLFAKFIDKNSFDLKGLKLKGIISSAETLPKDKQDFIESVFGCKVLNRYGSREVGIISSECREKTGLHINSENVIVEIEKDGKPVKDGELGEIIVTDLWNYGMPFVRYRMGDVATKASLEKCPCGRGLPLMKDVVGRVGDFIIDSNGGLIHGEYFTHLFYGVPGVKQFQFIQESKEEVVLKIHAEESFDRSVLNKIYPKISRVLGEGIKVNTEYLDTPLIESSGKFRFTISKLSPKYFNE